MELLNQDKGTRFYKSDFQVHTPRDINWVGKKVITDEERKIYAESFVKKCREIGLNAVAITDHHDFVFFPYIKEASEQELSDDGSPLTKEKQLVVFPGLELTFSTPASCQGILILNADFPQKYFGLVLGTLGIHPNDKEENSTAEIQPIPSEKINGFKDFYEKFDSVPELKGQYILLPNVSNGHGGILRRGFYEHYKKMPCVGGYVDGNIPIDKKGYLNIINGKDRNYGFKPISVIQTSDNREETFSKLGKSATWIKWAEPTAEALRQAFLAKESRLSQTLPETPQIYITKIDVTGSKFLGSFSLEFNQQYNALIGGRGTGKSSILEYLRWGLCDLDTQDISTQLQSEVDRKRQSLIEKTLVPFDGDVRISFNMNGIAHIVKRKSSTKETLLKIGNSEFELVGESELRKILPIQAYSQKQLSSVGVRTEELKRFIHLPIVNDLDKLKFQISDNIKETHSVYNNVIRKRSTENEISKFKLEIKSIKNQAYNLRKSLSGITEEHKKIIENKQKYDLEKDSINKVKIEISTIKNEIEALILSLKNYPTTILTNENIENKQLFLDIESFRKKKFQELKQISMQFEEAINEQGLHEFEELLLKWNKLNNDFDTKYKNAKEASSENQAKLQELNKIEKRLQEISKLLEDRQILLKKIGEPEIEFQRLRKEWFDLYKKMITLLNTQASYFDNLSKGRIKAEITKNIDIKQLKEKITIALQGSRIQEIKIQSICNCIIEDENPLNVYENILDELKLLAEAKPSEDGVLNIPDTPILLKCKFEDSHKKKIIEVLTPEVWLNIATAEIEFNPEFKYVTNRELGDQILFSDASAGQQATALLTVLLNQPGAPLLIDQPEDDIDNRAIDEIIGNIWNAKKKRQLIFTSHNANLVVNGDSELVVCCDYKDSGSQTRGAIVSEGSIDSIKVKEQITSVMEGGEKAFKLRKEKYGF